MYMKMKGVCIMTSVGRFTNSFNNYKNLYQQKEKVDQEVNRLSTKKATGQESGKAQENNNNGQSSGPTRSFNG